MTQVAITWVEHILGDEQTYDEEGHSFRKDLPPGASCWLSDVEGIPNSALVYICACGCGAVGCVNVSKPPKEQYAWLWDGNVTAPTLTPSIQKTFGCHWHGVLTAGVFIQC